MKKQNLLQNNLVVCLLAGVCCFLWGSAFPCIKIGYQLFTISSTDTASQILFAGIRFLLAGILAIIFGSIGRRRIILPGRRAIPHIFLLCLLQTVLQYVLFYIGLARTAGVKSSIIEAANVFIAIFVSCLFFHQEKITGRKLIGCFIGFLGVILINLNNGAIDTSVSFFGEGFILLSTIAYAFSSVLLKYFSKEDDPVMLSGYQFACGGIIMIACALPSGGRITSLQPGALPMLFYLACISAIAYSIWGILLKYNPLSRVAVYGFMNPVFGVILSALWLGESNQAFGWNAGIALVLVCLGIFIVNHQKAIKP